MIGPLELLLFVVLSAVAIAASVHAWRTHQAYGYFRFFAFEFLAVLIVWNASHWFREPLSLQQTVSWTIIAGSTALAVHGLHLLGSIGRAQRRVMEDTQAVVEVGAHRYIRHPLYASLMFFGWGVLFKVSIWRVLSLRWRRQYSGSRQRDTKSVSTSLISARGTPST
jgi:protein-S-isoprenylcysteine O-methyltransferase Ste14